MMDIAVILLLPQSSVGVRRLTVVVRKKETRWPGTGKEVAESPRADEIDLDACVDEVAKSIGRTAETVLECRRGESSPGQAARANR